MKKIQSLVLLINSLSKSEKKALLLNSNITKGDKSYMALFKIIDKGKITDPNLIQQEFTKSYSATLFHPIANYLYNYILEILVKIKSKTDKTFSLHAQLLSAFILHERNLYTDYYNELQNIKKKAIELNDFHILLQVQSHELMFLQENNLYQTSEQELFKKQHEITETFKILRQISEQGSIYQILMMRILKSGTYTSADNSPLLNDLVVSEISISNRLKNEIFEVQKLHQMFQAQYFIFAGNYKLALNSFIELEKLFVNNQNLWDTPPRMYLKTLEGVLSSLLAIDEYNTMPYFVNKIEEIATDSAPFKMEMLCAGFIYTISPLLKNNEVKDATKIFQQYKESLIDKKDQLTPYRYAQLSLFCAIFHMKRKDYSSARKQITHIINGKSYESLNIFKEVQLLNLVIHYQLKDHDIITSRVRSIKRQNKINKHQSKLEEIFFSFITTDILTLSDSKKKKWIASIENAFTEILKESLGRSILLNFDYKKWMLDYLHKT